MALGKIASLIGVVAAVLIMYPPQLWTVMLVCVTAILTLYLPKLWTKTRPVITAGTVEPGFEPVAKLFRENFENGVEYSVGGSAFSVYYKGSTVVDIWGGYADSEAGRPWKEDTMAAVFSATKGMTALCMATLVDRGYLDYERTVASYWPEFAQNGKENVTVRMLLNHQAGLSYTSEPITLALLEDQDALGKILAQTPPAWEPGTAHGYHGMTFGLYASQLLRRADPKHRTLGQFFKEEIAEPFDADFHIGLPLELYHRVARLTGDIDNLWLAMIKGLSSPLNRRFLWAALTGKSDFKKVLASCSDTLKLENFRRPEVLALEQPSAYGVGTARAIAKIYGILANGGQTNEGRRLLSDDVIKRITQEAKFDGSVDRSVGRESVFSLGFSIKENNGVRRFGHLGAGGMLGLADPERHLGLSYVSSYHSPFGHGDDPRFLSLLDETYECVRALEKG